jgi:ubiquinone/menaquinone biosynthesis C-methylase UbiE
VNFDRLAPHYDWLEAFTAGNRLQRARVAWLEMLAGRPRILSVGEGHGRFAAAAAARFPAARLTCVEGSPRMLELARRRTGPAATRVEWICTDLFAWSPAEEYDAIVTCFFLDCFPPDQLARAIAKLAGCASAGAIWLVVDFAVPASGLARWRAQAVHALMYGFFRVAGQLPARRLAPPDSLLLQHGFHLAGRQEFDWGLIRADLWRRD